MWYFCTNVFISLNGQGWASVYQVEVCASEGYTGCVHWGDWKFPSQVVLETHEGYAHARVEKHVPCVLLVELICFHVGYGER